MKKNYMRLIVALLFATNLMAQNVPNYVPTNGLVGWWPFNGNANDESGNGNNGTANGATLTTDRNGMANGAYNFNGISNIKISNNNNLNNLTSNFSISFWFSISQFYTNSSGDWASFFCKSTTTANPQYRLAYENKSKKFDLMFNGKQFNFYYSKGLIINQFYNVQIIIENNVIKFYINNEQLTINSTTNYSNYSINLDLLLGQDPAGLNEYHFGKLDDIAIYNRALTEQEIKQLYEGCPKETATSSSFNSIIYTTNTPINLSAVPSEGSFSGECVTNNTFNPIKARLGKNAIKYNFKNSKGCLDSTDFSMIVVDTIGNICSVTKYDTITSNVYDTVKVTKYDTITIKNNVYDTVKINKTIFDTVLVNKTIYDTLTVKNNVYDTITMTDTVSILKIKIKLTTGIYANQITSMSLYPNPTSDVLHIEVGDVTGLAGYRYRIVDALGKEVYNELVKNAITEIPLKTLGAAGIYQLEVLDQKSIRIQTNKIVLQ